ncbi:MAG: hypothetical protein M1826_001630 [Phylliscum demangeonii]|nr:MAG: hypothetical protein M1826_001630 [Phylliscum demangeonii]
MDGLRLLGSGSFAQVFEYKSFVFKLTLVGGAEKDLELLKEYEQFRIIYKSIPREPPSEIRFSVPDVYAFYNPATDELRRRSAGAGRGEGRDLVTFKENFAAIVKSHPGKASYCMDRLKSLPDGIAEEIRRTLYPPNQQDKPAPTMCRLYLGRPSPTWTTGRFINHRDYPLWRDRYEELERLEAVAPAMTIANAMGVMLFRLHWIAKNDARDVEFVMAGHPKFGRVALYILDFNQTSTIPFGPSNVHDADDAENDDVDVDNQPARKKMVNSFFDNDPYFPRPRPADPLYQSFRRGYLFNADHSTTLPAERFLAAIEQKQREKDGE